MTLSEQGIDVFNARDEFFNDICYPYDNPDGMDIIINDRRSDIYQNATFCQDGCSYFGMNYNLMVANCKCDSSIFQERENNVTENDNLKKDINTFKEIAKSFISNLIDFNFEILRCYNLILNKKRLIQNIGFFSLFGMLFLQIIFFTIYLIRKVEPIKLFMILFKKKHKTNKTIKNSNKINQPPPKMKKKNEKKLDDMNNEKQNKKLKNNGVQKYLKNNFDDIYFKNKESKDQSNSDKRMINIMENNLRKILQNNKYEHNKNQTPMLNINNNDFKKGINYNISSENDIIATNRNIKELDLKNNKIPYKQNILKQKEIQNSKQAYNMETIPENFNDIDYKNKKANKKVNKKRFIKMLNNDDELQDMNYEEAIIYDKRNYLKMFWSFLVESQIILGTFCTENYLNLFCIKLSFFVFTFQISFFLNALFYTDDYISDAYHNNGVLDFITGLPKSIYSFIATFITTSLLKMLSNSKNELIEVIKNRRKYDNYLDIINKKMSKLRKKLIVYFTLLFLLGIFFAYYVTVFCAVYRYSQKYWFFGCLESFAMDSLISLIACLFISLIRYISIKKKIKYCFVLANFITNFI